MGTSRQRSDDEDDDDPEPFCPFLKRRKIRMMCFYSPHREVTGKSLGSHQEITRMSPGCHRKSPESHGEVMGKSPGSHREVTWKSLRSHQEVTGVSPEGHQWRLVTRRSLWGSHKVTRGHLGGTRGQLLSTIFANCATCSWETHA